MSSIRRTFPPVSKLPMATPMLSSTNEFANGAIASPVEDLVTTLSNTNIWPARWAVTTSLLVGDAVEAQPDSTNMQNSIKPARIDLSIATMRRIVPGLFLFLLRNPTAQEITIYGVPRSPFQTFDAIRLIKLHDDDVLT